MLFKWAQIFLQVAGESLLVKFSIFSLTGSMGAI
jgi:hypothetical protein